MNPDWHGLRSPIPPIFARSAKVNLAVMGMWLAMEANRGRNPGKGLPRRISAIPAKGNAAKSPARGTGKTLRVDPLRSGAHRLLETASKQFEVAMPSSIGILELPTDAGLRQRTPLQKKNRPKQQTCCGVSPRCGAAPRGAPTSLAQRPRDWRPTRYK